MCRDPYSINMAKQTAQNPHDKENILDCSQSAVRRQKSHRTAAISLRTYETAAVIISSSGVPLAASLT